MAEDTTAVEAILRDARGDLLERWIAAQLGGPGARTDLLSETELRTESQRFLDALAEAISAAQGTDTTAPDW
ncbi:MAG: RsbRD N-terminal domain-containing protein, partial [Solirubrobacteraceae bacterium]